MENEVDSQVGFRILLRVFKQQELQRRCFIYINFEKMKTVNDVENHIRKLLGYRNLSLYIRESWLPKHESSQVITNRDILVAKLDDDEQGRLPQSPLRVDKVTNSNITAKDFFNKEKITSPPNDFLNAFNIRKNKPNNIQQKNDLDSKKLTKKGPNLDLKNSMVSLLQQLEMKKSHLLKQQTVTLTEKNEPNEPSILSSLMGKPLKTKLNATPNTEYNIANPTLNDSPAVKKKRIRKHKRKTKQNSAASNESTSQPSTPTNIKPSGLGKHIRFCNEHENCSGECTVKKDVEKKYPADDSETRSKEIVITSNDEGITEEITPVIAPVEISQQIPNFENITRVSSLVSQSKEEIGTADKVDLPKIVVEDSGAISQTMNDENKLTVRDAENEGALDATMEDDIEITVEKTRNVDNEPAITADENEGALDATMEDVDEAINESIGNELAIGVPMRPLQGKQVELDEFNEGDENHDDWKTRLLNLANEKEIKSKIFNRKSTV